MKFSINSTPPTEVEIQNYQEKLKTKSRKFKIWERTIMFFSVPLIIETGLWARHFGDEISNVLPNAISVGFSVLAITGLIASKFSDRAIRINKLISLLQPVPKDQCEEALRYCQSDAVCERYRQAVAAQGRLLTIMEVKVMESWVKLQPLLALKREKERKQELACAQLHS
jgi:hypothetical protein